MPRAATRTLRASQHTGSTAPASTAWSNVLRALYCTGRQPACLSTERESMLRTLTQRQLACPPIRLSHRRTAVHEHLQLCCSTLKLWGLPSLSQLCAVQRASHAVPGRPLARPGGCETEARRASASCIGGHVSRRRERAAQRGRKGMLSETSFIRETWLFKSRTPFRARATSKIL